MFTSTIVVVLLPSGTISQFDDVSSIGSTAAFSAVAADAAVAVVAAAAAAAAVAAAATAAAAAAAPRVLYGFFRGDSSSRLEPSSSVCFRF